MEVPRGSLSVALSMSSPDSRFAERRSLSRSDSQSSSESARPSRLAMAIPGARHYEPPPALPPPRYIDDLADGNDVGFLFGNRHRGVKSTLPPIKEGSSLLGSSSRHKPQQCSRRRMEMDHDLDLRTRTASLLPSKPGQGTDSHIPQLVKRPPSPTNPNTQLHGDRPLVQQNHNRSSKAYDQNIVSKIGMPPRHLKANSSDNSNSPMRKQLSVQTKGIKAQATSVNEPLSAVEPVRWVTSPSSTGLSPTSRTGWQDCLGPTSPGVEGAAASLHLDPELFVPSRSNPRQPVGNVIPVMDDLQIRSGRSSYDHGLYTPADSDCTGDDSVSLRRLSMDELQAQDQRKTKPGQKRRAASPPGEGHPDERSRQEAHPRLSTRFAPRSPNPNHPSQGGSISSMASSVQHNSYASSTALSAAASSMTSMSSLDTQSPRDSSHSPYITSAAPVESPMTLLPRKPQERIVPRRMPIPTVTPTNDPRPAPARIGNHFICACCPKKPKKFESEELLREHENEKQYSCAFCHNRFKNKNEAERHQNSLHLRRHSWSCAALISYEAAFSVSGAADSSSTATDACGYCGEEFPNLPTANWERRIEHLTNVHKFGECNSAKKFFRADHFRQHLKHSHAGKSGKWTNILEHACVRDEMPPEPMGYSSSASDAGHVGMMRGPSSLSIQTDVPISVRTIREAHDEDC